MHLTARIFAPELAEANKATREFYGNRLRVVYRLLTEHLLFKERRSNAVVDGHLEQNPLKSWQLDYRKMVYIVLSSFFSLISGALDTSRYFYQAEILNLAKDLFWSVNLARKESQHGGLSPVRAVLQLKKTQLRKTVFAMLIVEITAILSSLLRDQFSSLGKQELIRTLKVKLFESLLTQDYHFFETRDMWEQRQIIGNCGTVVTTLLDYPVECLEALGRTLSSLSILWQKNEKLSLFVFTLMPLKLFLSIQLQKWQDHLEVVYVAADLRGKMNQVWKALTQPRAFLTIRIFGREPEEVENFANFLRVLDRDENQRSMLYKLFAPIEPFLANAIEMLVLWYGGRLIIDASSPDDFTSDDGTDGRGTGRATFGVIERAKSRLMAFAAANSSGSLAPVVQFVLQLARTAGVIFQVVESGKEQVTTSTAAPSVSPASRHASGPAGTQGSSEVISPPPDDHLKVAAVQAQEQSQSAPSEDDPYGLMTPDLDTLGFGDLSTFLLMANNAFDSARFLRMRAQGIGDEILEPAERIMTLLQAQPRIGLYNSRARGGQKQNVSTLSPDCSKAISAIGVAITKPDSTIMGEPNNSNRNSERKQDQEEHDGERPYKVHLNYAGDRNQFSLRRAAGALDRVPVAEVFFEDGDQRQNAEEDDPQEPSSSAESALSMKSAVSTLLPERNEEGAGENKPDSSETNMASNQKNHLQRRLSRKSSTSSRPGVDHELLPLPFQFKELHFDNVSFRYPSRPAVRVLRGVSFKLSAGDHLGILGQTGSGKSSVFLLMLRVYDPDKGRILLNGHDLREYEPLWLRRKVFSVVTQDVVLLERSIKDNIMYGSKPNELLGPGGAAPALSGASAGSAATLSPQNNHPLNREPQYERRVQKVMEIAQCRSTFFDAKKFPQGWYTHVGEYGSKLSGGQQQRVALARALFKPSQVLLLDEATSALDEKTQAEVQASLEAIRKSNQFCLVTIAHRLSNFRFANRLLVLRDGQKIEEGTAAELLKQNGTYARYVSYCLTEHQSGTSLSLPSPEGGVRTT
ncbi:unnamed protein product [Amoebophrya sp. A120]|nr:unnamed protein product [Amoebophrya sp. A120]|eukprot:GSA120T00003712001.1